MISERTEALNKDPLVAAVNLYGLNEITCIAGTKIIVANKNYSVTKLNQVKPF